MSLIKRLEKYKRAMEREKGYHISWEVIAKELDISLSSLYNWRKGKKMNSHYGKHIENFLEERGF
jgi:hypothetical protein